MELGDGLSNKGTGYLPFKDINKTQLVVRGLREILQNELLQKFERFFCKSAAVQERRIEIQERIRLRKSRSDNAADLEWLLRIRIWPFRNTYDPVLLIRIQIHINPWVWFLETRLEFLMKSALDPDSLIQDQDPAFWAESIRILNQGFWWPKIVNCNLLEFIESGSNPDPDQN